MTRFTLASAFSCLLLLSASTLADYSFVPGTSFFTTPNYIQYGPGQDFALTNAGLFDYSQNSAVVKLQFGMKYVGYSPTAKRTTYTASPNYQLYITQGSNVLVGAVFSTRTGKVDDMGNGRFLFYCNNIEQTIPATPGMLKTVELTFVWNTALPQGYQIEYGYVHVNQPTFTGPASTPMIMEFENFYKELGILPNDEEDNQDNQKK